MYHRYHIYTIDTIDTTDTIDTIDTLILFSFPKGFSITRVAPDRLRHTPFFRGGASRSDSRRTWGRHGTRYETPSNIDWKQQIMEIMYSHPPKKNMGDGSKIVKTIQKNIFGEMHNHLHPFTNYFGVHQFTGAFACNHAEKLSLTKSMVHY